MGNLNLQEKINEQAKIIDYEEMPEVIYGQALTMPFAPTEDGSRALIAQHQYLQLIPLNNPETPIIGTGFENKFGDRSHSIIQADADYIILGKVEKFSKNPGHHYFLIVKNIETGVLDYIERKNYEYTTEAFGVTYNNTLIDRFKNINSTTTPIIPKGSIIRKSSSYDKYLNRCDGKNLRTAYIALSENTEDSQVFGSTGALMMSSTLVHRVVVMKNENDIFLNLMGTNEEYKSFPDIGEKLQNGILLATRKVVNSESLYMQSADKLKQIMMSDDKFTISGDAWVEDINIYVNNPEKLSQEFYDSQLLRYHEDNMRFINEFMSLVAQYALQYPMSYRLEKMYCNCNKIINGAEFVKEKKFSDLMIEFIVLENNVLTCGDKTANRFGGKGVVSSVIDDSLMPTTEDGEIIHLILSPEGVPNRENGGQLYDLDVSGLDAALVKVIKKGLETKVFDTEDAFELIVDFIKKLSTSQAEYIENAFNVLNGQEELIVNDLKAEFVGNIIEDGIIHLQLKPIQESMTIDDLADLHDEFNYRSEQYLMIPIIDSNGKIRRVRSKRPIPVGWSYTYRMKQYGEEKFSVTSLSSTNIKNENSRNKANTIYKSPHATTPVNLGVA